MTCNHNAAQCVESTGGVKQGEFREKYQCECGATGTITGEASDPATWDRTGEVFA